MLLTMKSVVLSAIPSSFSFMSLPISSSLKHPYRTKAATAAHVAVKPICAMVNSDSPPTNIDNNPIARFIILLCVVCCVAWF
ncbi:MAG: hypothetical protein PG978_000206 [Wolbachia endosymbiont of Ctenocephalides felis wCfeF]|nr:MAG: hypothetical protein PG978_000206 [Wolbachia endosymbiont of Ctenocephalides felis wCfeF]